MHRATRRMMGAYVAMAAVAAVVGIACAGGRHVVPAPPAELHSRDSARYAGPLPADDPRRVLVGEWEYVLTLARDCARLEIRDCTGASAVDAVPAVNGRLRVSDSTFTEFPVRAGIARSAMPDFGRALGREVSCTSPDWLLMRAEVRESELQVEFTPWGADCGVYAVFDRGGDVLRGTWTEYGFAGPRATGRITLTRILRARAMVDSATAVRLAIETLVRLECEGSGGCSLSPSDYHVTGFRRERSRFLVDIGLSDHMQLGGGARMEVSKAGKVRVVHLSQ